MSPLADLSVNPPQRRDVQVRAHEDYVLLVVVPAALGYEVLLRFEDPDKLLHFIESLYEEGKKVWTDCPWFVSEDDINQQMENGDADLQ